MRAWGDAGEMQARRAVTAEAVVVVVIWWRGVGSSGGSGQRARLGAGSRSEDAGEIGLKILDCYWVYIGL